MYIYIRKLFANDANGNQISFKKDVAIHFFQANQGFLEKKQNMTIHVFHFNNERHFEDIELQSATDYRISTRLNSFLAENEDEIGLDDLLYMEKIGKSFGVKLIKKSSPNYKTFEALLNINDRHLLICTDEDEAENEEGESKPMESSQDTEYSPRQIIWYGAPGTGKSFTVNSVTNKNNSIRTTFHPDSDYASFVGAYKPTLAAVKQVYHNIQGREEEISYKFIPQAFLKAYVAAWKNYVKNPEAADPYYLVIEEINRGNCAQIFGDLFQLLDRDDNGISTYEITPDTEIEKYLCSAEVGFNVLNPIGDFTSDIRDGKVLKLPCNLYIYATMNTSDQSLFPIDSAFKRRWEWRYTPISKPPIKNWTISVNNKNWDWWNFLRRINFEIGKATDSEDKKLGYFFARAKKVDAADVDNNNGVIEASTFVSKVLFYLWSDVIKDYEFNGDLLRDKNGKTLDFTRFFKIVNGKTVPNEILVEQFIENVMNVELPDLDNAPGDTTNSVDSIEEDNI